MTKRELLELARAVVLYAHEHGVAPSEAIERIMGETNGAE